MYVLSSKTKNDIFIQGAERVYFTSHPDDFGWCFKDICDDIFKTQNCTIYYDTDLITVRSDEDMYRVLKKEMRLFVIPITKKFLLEENRARCVELPYALKYNIPVLPLMQESGLEEDFNRLCGDIQFLDKNVYDPTVLPFDEKLEKYLSSILLGEELANKVRSEFDAYIFLSYRKSDRKYAQDLMRLIHRDEICRDVAIWYDEFLKPGEDFNHSIKEAMKTSKLFALVVTPRLAQPNEKGEPNYIQRYEYPDARDKYHLPILPIEMETTDRESLEAFVDLPKIIAWDDENLNKLFFDELSKYISLDNDANREHNYYIGLAYLGGVDVEIDHERALRLITSAAFDGLIDAIEKLISMYTMGDGVDRDYRTAIAWHKKLVEIRKSEFESIEANPNAFYSLFDALLNLGNAQKDVGDLEDAKITFISMKMLCEENLAKFDCKYELLVSIGKLGEIAQEEDKERIASKHYKKCLNLAKKLANEANTLEIRRVLSVCYVKLGDIAESRGRLIIARKYYKKSLEFCKSMNDEKSTVQTRMDLSIAYDRLGDVCKRNQIDKRIEYYEKSLEIREYIYKERETVIAFRALSISHEKLGDMAVVKKEYDEAQYHYEISLEIREIIAAETQTIQANDDLSKIYLRLGVLPHLRAKNK